MEVTMIMAARWSPVRVGDVLVAALPGLRDHMLDETIRKNWGRVVGPDFARRSRPTGLRLGVLDVTADNSPWLHELTLRSSELLARLETRYGSAVTGLRFTLGTVPTESSPMARERRPEPPARLGPEDARMVEVMVAPVADPALAASLRRLLAKDLLARQPRGAGRRLDDSPPPDREDS
jgi:hypothetical protein